jgi:hypothetical protein
VKESRRLLQHFLAALAYRTQKALRDAPDAFGEFSAGTFVRTPHELLWHMSGVIGYARTQLHGGTFQPPRLPTFADDSLIARISDEQFLQGPLADAMTHAGQLALLRRLAGSPVPSEDFIEAAIDSSNVSERQRCPWRRTTGGVPTSRRNHPVPVRAA